MSKQLLYIGTPSFGFYKHIIEDFQSRGYEVDHFNDRPSENSFVKGAIKLRKSLVQKYIIKYFNDLLEHTKMKQYDLVLIVNGKVIDQAMVQQLKKTQPSAKFVYYTWDSVALYPNTESIISEFDKAYTFDLSDSRSIKGLDFLPLFYSKGFQQVAQEKKNINYDLMSVCTAHPNRYAVISDVYPKLISRGYKMYSFLYLNKLQYLYNKFRVKEFKYSKRKEFSFVPLTEQENLEIVKQSNAVFDVEHNKQTGLTIRTLETLGAKRKLITTNQTIKEYDFYNENNILIFDGDLNKVDEFLKKPYEEIDKTVYQKYSLSHWIDTLLEDKHINYLK